MDDHTSAVLAEQIEKKGEMLATIRAVKGDEYAAAIQAGAVLVNFINSMATMGNQGAVHPVALPALAAAIASAQVGVATFLALISKGDDRKAEAMTADMNALLKLVDDARTRINGVKP